MRRFSQDQLFSELAGRGALSGDLLVRATRMILRMHARASPTKNPSAVTHVSAVAADIAKALSRPGSHLDQHKVAAFRDAAQASIDVHRQLMQDRLAAGWIRRCHGDLHLRNIVLDAGSPVAFDALEFDDELATVDVLDDLAFLLMDLLACGDRHGSNLVLNTYLGECGSTDHVRAIGLVPLFMALRAGVRARVASDREPTPNAASTSPGDETARYLELACDLLTPEPVALFAIGGLSGTGKSTVARNIAGALGRRIGAVHLRTDVVRKQIAGIALTQSLPASHYTPEASRRVYQAVIEQAQGILEAGLPVIVDAVFGTQEERDQLARAAAGSGARLNCVWLSADAETLKSRVAARRGDASDATVEVVDRQVAGITPPADWQQVWASGELAATVSTVEAALAGGRP
jgi:predicted kinase